MPAKSKITSEVQQDEPGEARPVGFRPDDVDAQVSSFLAELTGISAQMQQRGIPADAQAVPGTRQARILRVPEHDEEVCSESELQLQKVNHEVEQTLIELERLKPKVLPITGRKDSEAEPPYAPAASQEPPAATAAPRPRARPAAPAAVSGSAEYPWGVLDALRTAASSYSARRRRKYLFGLLAAAMAVILGCFHFLRSDKITSLLSPITEFEASLRPNEPEDTPDASIAKEISASPQGSATNRAAQKPRSPGAVLVTAAPAEALVKVLPTYPNLARMQKVDGVVELEASINEKGNVIRAKAVAGPMLLRAAAEDALLKWKFKPASSNGADIASRRHVSIAFNLK